MKPWKTSGERICPVSAAYEKPSCKALQRSLRKLLFRKEESGLGDSASIERRE